MAEVGELVRPIGAAVSLWWSLRGSWTTGVAAAPVHGVGDKRPASQTHRVRSRGSERTAAKVMPKLTSVHHLALTVTDVERSVPWYARVLDLEESHRREDPETGVHKVVLKSAGDGFSVVLVQHPDTDRRCFDERRTGLDHVAFSVTSKAELCEWEERLSEYGVSYRPPRESRTFEGSSVIVFRDPDGIQLEIWSDPEL